MGSKVTLGWGRTRGAWRPSRGVHGLFLAAERLG